MRTIYLLTIMLLCMGIDSTVHAQTPTSYVKKYNLLMGTYLNEGDVEAREEIDELLRGGRTKCYITNELARDIARERNIDVQLMHSDTYHNELLNWREKGVIDRLLIDDIEWQQSWVEPRIKTGKNDTPILFVSARLHTDGTRNYNSAELFFLQGNHIVGIENLGEGAIGNAIQLYNLKRYNEAFKIFRSIAYTQRNALNARYYTAVMLIQNQGCKNIDKKVRDNDAAWLGLSGYLSGDEDLTNLSYKFNMNMPFSKDHIIHFAPAFNGRRIIKKGHDKFGIMDDSGQMIMPFRKGTASPLSCSGVACIKEPNTKWGLIDSDGNTVLPLDFDNIHPYFYDNKIYAIKDGALLLMSKSGIILRRIPGEFKKITVIGKDGQALVENGNRLEVYNFNGELILESSQFSKHVYNKNTGLNEFIKDDEKVMEFYEMW